MRYPCLISRYTSKCPKYNYSETEYTFEIVADVVSESFSIVFSVLIGDF